MDLPADLKYIAPYLQRGQELAEREPIISYYAQYYAAKLALSRGPSNKETNAYLSQLLDKLEQAKAALGPNNEAITDDLVGYAHVENFALKVFLNADNEDRAGKASKKTAKTFLAASIFLELLKTFGDLPPEVEAKIKYAKWKATDIMKALREGRVPAPGPPGGQQADESTTTSPQPTSDPQQTSLDDMAVQPPSSISEFPSPPSNFTAPLPSSSPTQNAQQAPHAVRPPANDSTPPSVSTPPPTFAPAPSQLPSQPSPSSAQNIPPRQPSSTVAANTSPPTATVPAAVPNIIDPARIASSQKHAKWAISALNYDDIKTARIQLLEALNDLGFNLENNFGY